MKIEIETHWAKRIAIADRYEEACEQSVQDARNELPSILNYCSGNDSETAALLLEVESEFFEKSFAPGDLKEYLCQKYAEQRALIDGFVSGLTPREASCSVPGYELLSTVGQGAYGLVRKAKRVGSDELFAIKIAKSRQGIRWLDLEHRALLQIDHKGVVAIHDAGKCADGASYLCLEYLEGPNLRKFVEASGRLSYLSAVGIILEILKTLEYLHSSDLYHGDLSPNNIVVADRGAILIDFGFAASDGPWSMNIGTLSRFGTRGYRATHDSHGGKLTHAERDLFALLSVFSFMLFGRPLFSENSTGHAVESMVIPVTGSFISRVPSDIVRLFNFDRSVEHRQALRSASRFAQFLQQAEAREARRIRKLLTMTAALAIMGALLPAMYFVTSRYLSRPQDRNASPKSQMAAIAIQEDQLDEAIRLAEQGAKPPDWFIDWQEENSIDFAEIEASFAVRIDHYLYLGWQPPVSAEDYDEWLSSRRGPIGRLVLDFGERAYGPLDYSYQVGDLPWDYAMVDPLAENHPSALSDQELWGYLRDSHIRARGPVRMRISAMHNDHEDIAKRSIYVVAEREFDFDVKEQVFKVLSRGVND